jgi:hypothetical protein
MPRADRGHASRAQVLPRDPAHTLRNIYNPTPWQIRGEARRDLHERPPAGAPGPSGACRPPVPPARFGRRLTDRNAQGARIHSEAPPGEPRVGFQARRGWVRDIPPEPPRVAVADERLVEAPAAGEADLGDEGPCASSLWPVQIAPRWHIEDIPCNLEHGTVQCSPSPPVGDDRADPHAHPQDVMRGDPRIGARCPAWSALTRPAAVRARVGVSCRAESIDGR